MSDARGSNRDVLSSGGSSTAEQAPAGQPPMERVPLLSAAGISKQFDGIRALDEVPLTVHNSECVGLIGPNGAGKTTLFDCLTGRVTPDAGEVSFRGRRLDRLSGVARARLGLARTFQRIELFGGMSVADHLQVAIQGRTRRAHLWHDIVDRRRMSRASVRERHERGHVRHAEAILDMLGLSDDADRPIEALTLGKARLVELGRALACDPVLLFLDEPSSGLDRTEADALGSVLEQVRQDFGVAILLVEHNVPLVRRLATRLYVLDAGRLIAEGPTPQVLGDPKVRTAYLGAEA